MANSSPFLFNNLRRIFPNLSGRFGNHLHILFSMCVASGLHRDIRTNVATRFSGYAWVRTRRRQAKFDDGSMVSSYKLGRAFRNRDRDPLIGD
jgi:hypothetical protein